LSLDLSGTGPAISRLMTAKMRRFWRNLSENRGSRTSLLYQFSPPCGIHAKINFPGRLQFPRCQGAADLLLRSRYARRRPPPYLPGCPQIRQGGVPLPDMGRFGGKETVQGGVIPPFKGPFVIIQGRPGRSPSRTSSGTGGAQWTPRHSHSRLPRRRILRDREGPRGGSFRIEKNTRWHNPRLRGNWHPLRAEWAGGRSPWFSPAPYREPCRALRRRRQGPGIGDSGAPPHWSAGKAGSAVQTGTKGIVDVAGTKGRKRFKIAVDCKFAQYPRKQGQTIRHQLQSLSGYTPRAVSSAMRAAAASRSSL
jgi:hypothetical protein